MGTKVILARVACAAAALAVVVLLWQGEAAAQDLQGKLEEVGREYAKGYLAPLVSAFGANQNSGLYTTAAIPRTRLTFAVGLRIAGTHISEDDQSFRRVIPGTLNEDVGVQPGDPGYGQQGTLQMDGPTVFGNEDIAGRIQPYYQGLPVGGPLTTIAGVKDTRWVPLVIPEASLGGVAGLRATFRWFPEIDIGDLGKVKFFGYGLQYSVNGLVPTLPVDVMVGFFRQNLHIGDLVDAEASSYFVGVSKSSVLLTLYGGAAVESSSMDIAYTWHAASGDVPIAFTMDGEQESRLTLGATLDLGLKLNAEVNQGKMATYSGGVSFGF